MTPEGKVKREIRAGFDALGSYVFMPVQYGYGSRGVDFYACVPFSCPLCGPHGRFIAVEAKRRGGGRATALQQRTIVEVRGALGAGVEEARSWAEVEDEMRRCWE